MKGLWAILLVVLYFTLSFLASCDTRTGRELSAGDVYDIDILTDFSFFYCPEDDPMDWDDYRIEMFQALEDEDAEEFLYMLEKAGEHYEELEEHIEELEKALEDVRDILRLDK